MSNGSTFKRKLSTKEIRLKLLRSGLHPHPHPPGDLDDPEGNDDFTDDADDEYLRQMQANQLQQNIAREVDGIHAMVLQRTQEIVEKANEATTPEAAEAARELSEEFRQLIATNRAAAIARKTKLALEVASAAEARAEALEASRLRCQQCNNDPIAEATAAREAAMDAMELSRECNCRGCKENVLGVDCTRIAPMAPFPARYHQHQRAVERTVGSTGGRADAGAHQGSYLRSS